MLEFYSPILPSTHLLVTTRYGRSCYKLQGGMGNGCSHSNKLAPSIIQKKNECRKMWATFVHAIKLNVNWFWFVTENFGGKKKPTRIHLNLNSDLWFKKGKRNFNFQLEQSFGQMTKREIRKDKVETYIFSFISHDPKNIF